MVLVFLLTTIFANGVVAQFGFFDTTSCSEPTSFDLCGVQPTCDVYGDLSPGYPCSMGCFCPSGLVVDENNSSRCLGEETCKTPPKCPVFEVFKSYGADNICPSSIPQESARGCHCKDGYVRRKPGGLCVPEPCPVCGENEYFDEDGPTLKMTCRNYAKYKYLDYTLGQPGCNCQQGFIFDEKANKCVIIEECSESPECQENEEFKTSGIDDDCVSAMYEYSVIKDEPNCYCSPGFVRETRGNRSCVSIDNCNCPENQYPTYTTCHKTCDTRSTERCETDDTKSCTCNDGYVFENINSNLCILEEDCQNPPKCPENFTVAILERHNFCPDNPRGNHYLDNSGGTPFPDCFCTGEYAIETSSYECIKLTECPPIECKANMTMKTAKRSPSCSNDNNEDTTTGIERLDCFCLDGYVRDADRCVLPEDCLICDENSELSPMGCDDTCDTFNPPRCQQMSYLRKCRCKSGHIFESSDSNRCIPIENCPNPVNCGENKIYKTSGFDKDCSTPSHYCSDRDDGPGCYCKNGFVKLFEGSQDCVAAESCVVCGENQMVANTDNCDYTCESYRLGLSCNVLRPTGTCMCQPHFALKNENSTECIPEKECINECDVGKEFKNNGTYLSCWSVIYEEEGEPQTFDGCFCPDGLYESVTGKCVPKEDCNPCTSNATYGLVSKDEETCENWARVKNYFVDPSSGPHELSPALDSLGCICRPGYVKINSANCVLKDDCPNEPVCGENEEFRSGNIEQYCFDEDISYDEDEFKCYCKEGFVRNYKSQCISEESCPRCEEVDSNSFYSPCVHCYDYCDGHRNCSWNCLGDCDCKPGFVHDDQGKCVSYESCTKDSFEVTGIPCHFSTNADYLYNDDPQQQL